MPIDDELDQPPWLRNPDWRENRIRSEARSGLRGAWLVAGIMLLPSAFIAAIVPGEVAKGNDLILIALVFPLAALITTVSALRKSLEWRRFGPLTVVLDPFPGSLGGDVGGAIEVAMPFDPARRCSVTLACVRAYVRQGGGDNREDVIWERKGLATARRSARGTRLAFRFQPPAGLAESEPKSADYRRWMVRLHLKFN